MDCRTDFKPIVIIEEPHRSYDLRRIDRYRCKKSTNHRRTPKKDIHPQLKKKGFKVVLAIEELERVLLVIKEL